MAINTFPNHQAVIISLDVDETLFAKLQHIAEAGFSTVEINSSDTNLLKQAIKRLPDLCIGAGNIINTEQLELCYQAGVHFTSSPGFLPAIAQTASIYSMRYFPGVATVSEAMQAMALGYQQVRPFPANLAFCSLLNKCLPGLQQYPAEIEWDEVEHFLNLPSVSAVSLHNPEQKQLKTLSSLMFA